MEHEKTLVFFVKLVFFSAVYFGVLEVFTYTQVHTSTYSIVIFTTLYFVLTGSLFYIYFIVSKFESIEKVNKAMYFLGSFDVICMVIVQFIEFDTGTIGSYFISFSYLWVYSILNAELRERGEKNIESSND